MVTRKPGGVKRTAGPSRASYDSQEPVIRYVARNRRARHDYDILEVYECGIALKGAEVKSLRLGQASLQDAYARIDDGELWLLGAHLAPYEYASGYGRFDPIRPRKLLLHRQQIDELAGRVAQKALTLVPLSLYFKDGLAKVELALASRREPLSLETPVGDDDNARLVDFVADTEGHDALDTLTRKRFAEGAHELLATLSPREADVLRMRFGLDGQTERTLSEIGESFHLTRERIRQIETQALRKLRLPFRSRRARAIVDDER